MIFSIILSILGGIIIFSFNWSNNKHIKSIKLVGLSSLKQDDILNLIDSSVYKTPKSKLKLAEIRNSLMKNKMVDSCIITSNFNDELLIEITEKKPMAYFISANKTFFVYKNGDSLSNQIGEYYPDLPIIRLKKLQNNLDSTDYSTLVKFLNNISIDSQIKISEITLLNQEVHIYLNFNGIKVNLGKVDKCNENMNKLNEFINLNKDLDYSKISYIDTRWQHRVIVNEIN